MQKIILSFLIFHFISITYGQDKSDSIQLELRRKSGLDEYPVWKRKFSGLDVHLNSLWINNTCDHGWAVGSNGTILSYDNSNKSNPWKKIDVSKQIADIQIGDIWMSNNGERGWAVGDKGIILEYNKSNTDSPWNVSKASNDTLGSLNLIYMNDKGNHGWAIGSDGIILEYDKSRMGNPWKKDMVVPGLNYYVTLNDIWMNKTDDHGWIVGGRGIILEYTKSESGNTWKLDTLVLQEDKSKKTVKIDLHSLWMNEHESHGWAVGEGGIILEYNNIGSKGVWKVSKKATSLFDLNALWINNAGDRGWAVGTGGIILEYDKSNTNNPWRKLSKPGQITWQSLNSIWMNEKGDSGWVIGTGGLILEYDQAKNTWEKSNNLKRITSLPLTDVWMNKNGDCGVAIAGGGVVLEYNKLNTTQPWNRKLLIDRDSLFESLFSIQNPNAIWMNQSCERGWVVSDRGKSTIMKYEKRNSDNRWEMSADGDLVQDYYSIGNLNDIWINHEKGYGWAVGDATTIYKYDMSTPNNPWKISKSFGNFDVDLNAIWLNEKGDYGWAVGSYGTIIKYENSNTDSPWIKFIPPNQISGEELNAVWMNKNGNHGWAVGNLGTIFEYDSTNSENPWRQPEEFSNVTKKNLHAIWFDKDGERGWAIGNQGTILSCNKSQTNYFWQEIHGSSNRITDNNLNSLNINDDGDSGWAVGENGNILSLKIEPINFSCTTIKKNVEDLNASINFISDHAIKKFELKFVNVELQIDKPIEIDCSFDEESDYTKGVIKLVNTEHFLDNYSGDSFYLEIITHYRDISHSTTYITDEFQIKEQSAWFIAGRVTIAFLLLNILLVILAIPFSQVRTFILHPIGSQIIGLIVGKYLILEALIQFIGFIRLGIFWDYRQNFKKAPFLNKWKDTTYISPEVSLSINESLNTQISNNTPIWKETFNQILNQRKNGIWLILGPSGLGKSALLENWVRYSLELKQTPILIHLGNDLSPIEEVRLSFEQYGDITAKANFAFDLLKRGGFVIFLDGFNEDQTPTNTREFIRQVSKKNTVIMTSQFEPSWNNILINYIELKKFSHKQLSALMPPTWVQSLLESELKSLSEMPHTAALIANYINRNQQLPQFHLDIYRDLCMQFDEDIQSVNLEQRAWELFKTNGRYFEPDKQLPQRLCEVAVNSGILTKEKDNYLFRHERISRFFVASYLFKQNQESIDHWHEELKKGLGKDYWADVLELLGEMYAEHFINMNQENEFLFFVKSVSKFNTNIFKTRLYPLYDRLVSSGKIIEDPEFVRWTARSLAGLTT